MEEITLTLLKFNAKLGKAGGSNVLSLIANETQPA